MEPQTSSPRRRLETVLKKFNDARVPSGVMVGPIIAGLKETEFPPIIEAANDTGARRIHYIPLRLPGGAEDVFSEWLEREFPDENVRTTKRLKAFAPDV